jgi:3',5'-nucleoside bisphosphate phosphatase
VKIDLHAHSSASDGSLSPLELVHQAAEERLDVLSLTDHDTTAGLAEARDAAERYGICLLPGVELSVCEQQGSVQCHVLGLGVDPSSPPLAAATARLRAGRRERIAAMVERLLRVGVDPGLGPEDLVRGEAAIGRPHLAQRLVERGYCQTQQQAFDRYLGRGKSAFLPPPQLEAREAIALIHAAGGIASLAHPLRSIGVDGPGGAATFVGRFARQGLDALEVQHPAQNRSQRRKLSRIALEQGLLETGGSDFHGASRPDLRLGRGRGDIRVSAASYAALCSALDRRRAALRAGTESLRLPARSPLPIE